MKSAGYGNFAFMAICVALYAVCLTFPQYWLKLWTESRTHVVWFYATGYILFTLGAWITTVSGVW